MTDPAPQTPDAPKPEIAPSNLPGPEIDPAGQPPEFPPFDPEGGDPGAPLA